MKVFVKVAGPNLSVNLSHVTPLGSVLGVAKLVLTLFVNPVNLVILSFCTSITIKSVPSQVIPLILVIVPLMSIDEVMLAVNPVCL